jgi:lysophospholipase L1-like esterase
VDGSEGFGRISINHQGVRGRDLPEGAPGRLDRLLFLGDSFTEARQVDDDETFCSLLEARLSRQLQHEVWIGNAGQSALDAADYLWYLPAYEQKLHPELFVIAYSPWDFQLNRKNQLVGLVARFDAAAAPGRQVRCQTTSGPGTVRPIWRAVLGRSSLARYAFGRFRPAREAERPRPTPRTPGDRSRAPRPRPRGYPRSGWRWREVEALEARSGPQPRIATVGQMEKYFQALVARSRTPIAVTYINFYSPVEPSDHHVEEERIRDATARLRIPFIPTSPAFQDDWARTGRLVNGFHRSMTGPGTGHLNAWGHQIVARALAPSLAGLLSDPSRPRRLRIAQARAQADSGEPSAVAIAGAARS